MQVYMLDKRQVDPRRLMGKATAQDMEERLAPYQEALPLIPQGAITQDKQVARLSGTHPASIKSVMHGLGDVLRWQHNTNIHLATQLRH